MLRRFNESVCVTCLESGGTRYIASTAIDLLYEKYQKPGDIKIFMLKGNIGRQRKKRSIEEKGRMGIKRRDRKRDGEGRAWEKRGDWILNILSCFFLRM